MTTDPNENGRRSILSRERILPIVVLGFLTILFVKFWDVDKDKTENEKEEKVESRTQPSDNTSNPKSLNRTYDKGGSYILIADIETFRQRFNAICKDALDPIRADQITIHEGKPSDPGMAFEYTLDADTYIVGGLNKSDNTINSLSIIIGVDNSATEAAKFLIGVAGIIASTNPDLQRHERGDIMKKVGLADKSNLNPADVRTTKTVKDGIEYSFTVIPGQGIVFHAGKPSN